MIAPARNADLQEGSTFVDNKAQLAFKKMSILSQLTRRIHDMLTTDAKPDPPRTGIKGYTHNLPSAEEPRKKQSKSMPTTPEKEHDDVTSMRRQKSEPNDATPTMPTDSCADHAKPTSQTDESKEYRRPRAKTKSKHSKYSQATNVVNYNIVNSNGVKIGSRTSYICNVNQYPANNASAAQSEATSESKPKHRSMSEIVEELSTCDEELTLDDIFVVKTHVGRGWRDVARGLSYSDGQIDQFEENYRDNGIDEVIYQLLLDWKQANTRNAQLGTLINVLWSCQEYECVERLVAERKAST